MKNSDRKVFAASGSVELDALIESGLIRIGDFYTFESINPILHGRLLAVTASFYVVSECSWLGDLGQRAEYESGKEPVESNYMGGTEEDPKFFERSAFLNFARAPIQKALSEPSKVK